MTSSAAKKRRDAKVERLELRASPSQTSVIRQAAAATAKTVTAFVLDAATVEAQRTIADRRLFRLDPDRWERFVNALDRPVKEKLRLRKLMKRPGILD
ncbi:MAG: DUF1778 domain-containing protein [Armatimonadetes bacterium]|nr:DUF1778 domain-containing protein [Armatimonadota bacterium]